MEVNKISLLKFFKPSFASELEAVKNAHPADFEEKNLTNTQIKRFDFNITKNEFLSLLKTRPLIKYKPARNSFIKRGDAKLLATELDIESSDLNSYINGIINNDFSEENEVILASGKNKHISKKDIYLTQLYIYRHGSQEQALRYFENELKKAYHILKTLYYTLDDNLGSIYRYYNRPCHALDNSSANNMYSIVDKYLKKAEENGQINAQEKLKASEWALEQIKKIQNTDDLRQAFKFIWKNK